MLRRGNKKEKDAASVPEKPKRRSSASSPKSSFDRSSVFLEESRRGGKNTAQLNLPKDLNNTSQNFHQFIQSRSALVPKLGWLTDMIEQLQLRDDSSSSPSSFRMSQASQLWLKSVRKLGHDGHFRYSREMIDQQNAEQNQDQLSISLEETLDTPAYFSMFESFLLDNAFEPVLDFLVDVRDFRRLRNESEQKTAAGAIFDRHLIAERAVVSLQPSVVRTIKSRLENGLVQGVFEEAYRIVLERLRRGDYQRFQQTPMYLEMLPEELAVRIQKAEERKHVGWRNEARYKSLHVDVLCALGLDSRDSGKSDVYVTVSVGSKTYKTRSDRGTVCPNWEQRFQLPVSGTSLYAKVCVWSRDLLGNKSCLGQTLVYMSDVQAPFLPKWYPLSDEDGEEPVPGEIHLRFRFSLEEASESQDGLYVEKDSGANAVAEMLRGKVSKKKKRFVEDGYNLDLTYVTDHIIAMGFPSESLEGFYRNNMKDVQSFFSTRHPKHYKIYNLCSERAYNPDKFEAVAHFGFDDHNPCPFDLLDPLCKDMAEFLGRNPQNVVSVHCKAGKGRTGLIISAFMLFSKQFATAEQSLDHFAERRTRNKKGVTIPSQIRWVHYFERYLSNPGEIPSKNILQLTAITIVDPAPIKPAGLIFKIQQPGLLTVHSKLMKHLKMVMTTTDEGVPALRIEFPEDTPLPLCDDVKVQFAQGSSMLRRTEKLFHCWFNTRFIQNDLLVLSKSEIDKAVKDKKHKLYSKGLGLVFEFEEIEDQVDQSAGSIQEQMKYVAGLPSKAFEWHEGKKKRKDSLSSRSVDSFVPYEKSNPSVNAGDDYDEPIDEDDEDSLSQYSV